MAKPLYASMAMYSQLSGRSRGTCANILWELRRAGFIEDGRNAPATPLALARMLIAVATPRLARAPVISAVEEAQQLVDERGTLADVGVAELLQATAVAGTGLTPVEMMTSATLPWDWIAIETRGGRLSSIAVRYETSKAREFKPRGGREDTLSDTVLLAGVGPTDVRRLAGLLMDRNSAGPAAPTAGPGNHEAPSSVRNACVSYTPDHATTPADVQSRRPPTGGRDLAPSEQSEGAECRPGRLRVNRG